MDLAKESAIKITIHAGEPGASIPSTKKMIEESWGAKCYDHAGATEVGAFGFQCQSQSAAIHVNEMNLLLRSWTPILARPSLTEKKANWLSLISAGSAVPSSVIEPAIWFNRATSPVHAAGHFCFCKVACWGGWMIWLLSVASTFFPAPLKTSCGNFLRSKSFAWKFLKKNR